jgi:uncharacterized protein (DUF1330 family)
MTYYFIAEMFFDNEDWWHEYMENVTPMLERHGCKVLARTRNYDSLDSKDNPPKMIAILEWPDKESAARFAAMPEYAPFAKLREANATSRAYMFPAEDELDDARRDRPE